MYSGKSGCVRAEMVVIEESDCIRVKLVVFGQSGCIRKIWLYSGKVVVFEKSRCIRSKVLVFKQKLLYWECFVELKKKCLSSGKVVLFGQKWLH